MEEITMSEDITLSKEVLNKTSVNKEDNYNESDSNRIMKYVGILLVLLFKIYAFMHINQNKSYVSKKVDTQSFEKFHAWFYTHTGWGHVIIDVVIYLFLAALFLLVSCKLIGSLWQIRLVSRKLETEKSLMPSNNRLLSWIGQLFGIY